MPKKVEPQSFIEVLILDTCRYIEGDPKSPDAKFCGKQKVSPTPYCENHCEICYPKFGKKKDVIRAPYEF